MSVAAEFPADVPDVPELVQERREGALAWLVIARPEVHNCLSFPALKRFRTLLEGLAADLDVRCVLITGAGGRAFCSGADLKELGGLAFAPKFDADGLITCVATDAASGDVLMVAHMNAQALARTIETGEAWYYSRSRRALWKKGESSGHVQRVREMRLDCDQDAVWIKVEQEGPGACHT